MERRTNVYFFGFIVGFFDSDRARYSIRTELLLENELFSVIGSQGCGTVHCARILGSNAACRREWGVKGMDGDGGCIADHFALNGEVG